MEEEKVEEEEEKVNFCEGSAENVKQMLMKGSTYTSPKLLRVATPLVDANPYAYTPRFISLGPYHCGKEPQDVFKANPKYDKIWYAGTLYQKLLRNREFNLDDMVAKIKENRAQMETFYQCRIPEGDYTNKFALMMLVDSFFLLQFLFGHYRGEHGSNLKCDILMLENQIPLFVLKQMFDNVKPVLVPGLCENAINYLLRKAYMELCPFDITPDTLIDYALKETVGKAYFSVHRPKETTHLLGCMHAIILQFLLKEGVEEKTGVRMMGCMAEPTLLQIISTFVIVPVVEKMCRLFFFSTHEPGDLPINGYTASELARAGIKFKSFSTPPQCIWFDKYSHKLYLPRMTVTYPTQTEVFFRNLLALEVNDPKHGNHVRDFIQLMDCLIDNSRDIRTLRKSHVICLGSALSDEGLAKIWDSMYQLFSNGHIEPPEELKVPLDNVLKNKCCMIKCRIALLKLCNGWYEQYLSKPWNVIGLLVGVFVLIVNVIQAYCSLWGCNVRSST